MAEKRKFGPGAILVGLLAVLLVVQLLSGGRSANDISYYEMKRLFEQEKVQKFEVDNNRLEAVLREIRRDCDPKTVELQSNMALIATVGKGMVRSIGTAAKLFTALNEANVNVRMIDQGSSEMNIIVGVESDDFETAVRAIYDAFA